MSRLTDAYVASQWIAASMVNLYNEQQSGSIVGASDREERRAEINLMRSLVEKEMIEAFTEYMAGLGYDSGHE